jgi:hypothetical protein
MARPAGGAAEARKGCAGADAPSGSAPAGDEPPLSRVTRCVQITQGTRPGEPAQDGDPLRPAGVGGGGLVASRGYNASIVTAATAESWPICPPEHSASATFAPSRWRAPAVPRRWVVSSTIWAMPVAPTG